MCQKKRKTLSVIIPNYNKKEYLSECLDSILSQTRLPDEIIVVDDASTDCSKDIAQEYAQRYPDLVRCALLPENHGVQYARNYGVSLATSEFITFLDSDDTYVDNKKLEREMKAARLNRIVSSEFCLIVGNDGAQRVLKYSKRDFFIFRLFPAAFMTQFEFMQYWAYAYIISKQAFLAVNGYDFPINYYEDLDILIKLQLLGIHRKMIWKLGKGYRVGTTDVSKLSKQTHLYEQAQKEIKSRYYNKVEKDIKRIAKLRSIKRALSFK